MTALSASSLARAGAALVAAAAVALTSSCAAGQHAATAEVSPAMDGSGGNAGDIKMADVAIHTPPGTAYPQGANAPMSVVFINTGRSDDTLNDVTSPAFGGWHITSSTNPATSGGPSSLVIPPGTTVSLGAENLGVGIGHDPKTLLLSGLTKASSPLYPGSFVNVTFHFAKAGSATVDVPVQLSKTPDSASVPPPSLPPSA